MKIYFYLNHSDNNYRNTYLLQLDVAGHQPDRKEISYWKFVNKILNTHFHGFIQCCVKQRNDATTISTLFVISLTVREIVMAVQIYQKMSISYIF